MWTAEEIARNKLFQVKHPVAFEILRGQIYPKSSSKTCQVIKRHHVGMLCRFLPRYGWLCIRIKQTQKHLNCFLTCPPEERASSENNLLTSSTYKHSRFTIEVIWIMMMMKARLSSHDRNGVFIKLSLCAFRSTLAIVCYVTQNSRISSYFLLEQMQRSFEQNFDP